MFMKAKTMESATPKKTIHNKLLDALFTVRLADSVVSEKNLLCYICR